MFSKKLIIPIFFVLILLCILAQSAQSASKKATLRNYQYGDKLPAFKLSPIQGGKSEKFSPGMGKPTIMMFFSVHPNFRKKRSLALLTALSELASKYKQKIKIIGVYSDNKDFKVVENYLKSSAKHIRVYSDPKKLVVDHYGVFMMPLAVMTTGAGKLHEVIPYTFNIRELIEGNIKVLLGKWTKKQLHDSLKPKQISKKSKAEMEYIRRVNYGRIMKDKKMYSQAIREFSTAIKIQPKSIEAYLELGFAEISEKEWDKAAAAFKKAQKIDKDSDDAIAGLGLTYYGKGDTKAAKDTLENAFIAPKPRLEVIIALADLYESEGNNSKANRLNKLAVSRLMTLYDQRWK